MIKLLVFLALLGVTSMFAYAMAFFAICTAYELALVALVLVFVSLFGAVKVLLS